MENKPERQKNCPYCHGQLPADLTSAKCPHCGKVIGLPSGVKGRMSLKQRRKYIERFERAIEHERRETGLDEAPSANFVRAPGFVAFVIVAFVIMGAGLFTASRNPGGRKMDEERRAEKTREEVAVLATALGLYRAHVGEYPNNDDCGLVALIVNPGKDSWRGPYITDFFPDRFGRPFQYDWHTDPPKLFSCGPDRKMHTADDIIARPEDFIPSEELLASWRGASQSMPSVGIGASLDPAAPGAAAEADADAGGTGATSDE